MSNAREQCLARASAFNDANEICDALLSIKQIANPDERYWLAEAINHTMGQQDLIASMAKILKESK